MTFAENTVPKHIISVPLTFCSCSPHFPVKYGSRKCWQYLTTNAKVRIRTQINPAFDSQGMIPAAQSLDKGEDAQVGSDQQHVENKGRLQVLPVKQLGFQGPSELESMFCVPPSPYQSILPLPGRARLNTSISGLFMYTI